MFESYWASEHFEPYDPADRRRAARSRARRTPRPLGDGASVSFVGLDVHPYPHQQRMLERLMVERERHERHRNLVVAATGTGKTVVAALDYRQLCRRHGRDLSLLFVAHRERDPRAEPATFRAVLRDGSFGEIHGGGRVAQRPACVRDDPVDVRGRVDRLRPDDFDVVIVDEFHHAAAPSYRRLLDRLDPDELLGLTATPERMDAQDVTECFDGRIAVELRLWEAIDEGFLVPFQYFGVADGTDLSGLRWQRGGYARDELDRVITGDDARVAKLLEAIRRVIADPRAMRALGFCVSIEHADFMARRFTAAGLDSGRARRARRPRRARDGACAGSRSASFGRLLRRRAGRGRRRSRCRHGPAPAARRISATVFTQQLGRGLRRADRKPYLTVIDLIGQQHRQFRFDDGSGAPRSPTRAARRPDRARLPVPAVGLHVELDRQSDEIVLDNLAAAARSQWRTLVEDLRGRPRAHAGRLPRAAAIAGSRRLSRRRQLDAAATRRRPAARAAPRRRATSERRSTSARPDAAHRRSGARALLPRAARGSRPPPTRRGSTNGGDGCC